jgi:hypothetical protein
MGSSATTLRERYNHMLNILFIELEPEITLDSSANHLYNGHWYNNCMLRVVAALDGYLQLITQPPDRQNRDLFQSGKEKDYCVSIFGLMGMDSKWLWRSLSNSIPDATAIRFEKSLEWTKILSSSEYIVADQAFYSLREYYERTIIPDLLSPDLIDNRGVSALRSIVELGLILAQRWKVNYCHWGDLQQVLYQVITIIMGLNNLYHKPFRQLDLEPSAVTGRIYENPTPLL